MTTLPSTPQTSSTIAQKPLEPPQPLLAPRFLLLIFTFFCLGHLISYIFRNINAVIYPELVKDLALDSTNLGLLTSVYLVTFALTQLPLGIALDRIGPRQTQALLLCIAALGAFIFSRANTLPQLILARGLIGLGMAGGLMAALKGCALWLPHERLPLASSILVASGGLGAMISTAPVQYALQIIDWREIFIVLSVLTLLLATAIFFTIPRSTINQKVQIKDMVKSVGQLYCSAAFWRIAVYTLFAQAAYMAIQGLWLGPWLRDVGHLSLEQASFALLLSTAAMVLGSLIFGGLADRLRRYHINPVFICGLGVTLFVSVQMAMTLPVTFNPWFIAIAFSFFGSSSTMNYAIMMQSVPSHLAGRASTSFNLLIFLMAFGVQWFIGWVLGHYPHHNGVYAAQGYTTALRLTLILQVAGVIVWLSFRSWKRN